MKIQDYDLSIQFLAQVGSTKRITPTESKTEVRDIVIGINNQGFDATIGQDIGVLAPGRKEIGQEHHFRLYSIADLSKLANGDIELSICVKRCTYIDEFSGEEYPGIASNYLCDLKPGDPLTISGPFGRPFAIPQSNQANLILIGAGTGIAPFRGFVKQLYRERPGFEGSILLVHGAQTGLELLYRNDEQDDFSMYYDRETFEAINALSQRPGWSDEIDWESAIQTRSGELLKLLSDSETCVYLAGLQIIRDQLEEALAKALGSQEKWLQCKEQLELDGRWVELLY